jgi:S1-C subfamily serine protease
MKPAAYSSIIVPFLAVCCTPEILHAAEPDLDGGALYEKAKAASVEVLIRGRQEGSGWFADPSGLLVTAAHAVWKRAKDVEIISPVAGRLPAEVLAFDRGHDIALLKVSDAGAPYPYLNVAKRPPPPGSDVFLFGAAFFRHAVMIRGNMARSSPTFEYLADQQCYTRVFHIAAPSPPGTSGGCWLDRKGRVVGNQSAFLSQNGVGMGIAMAASPDAIERLVRTRTSAGSPTIGSGLEEITSQMPDFISHFPAGTAGLVPVLPVEGGPAETAGLVGNIVITAADSVPVSYRDELMRYIRSKKPGDTVTFKILETDNPESRDIPVTLNNLDEP